MAQIPSIEQLNNMTESEFNDLLAQTRPTNTKPNFSQFFEQPAPPKKDLGFVSGNLRKGIGSFGQMVGGALGLFGDAISSEAIKNYGLNAAEGAQLYNRDINERMSTPEVNPGETYDKSGLWEAAKEVPQFVAEQTLQNLPLMIGTGGVTGLAARSATKAALAKSAIGALPIKATIADMASVAGTEATKSAMRRGALEGGLASGAQWSGLESGSIYAEQKEKDPLKALAYGVPAGMIEAIPEMYAVAKSGLGRKILGVGKDVEKSTPKLTSLKQVAGHTAVDLLEQGAMEGGQEVIQTGLEQLGKSQDITSREAIKEQILAGIAGAGMGVGLGGALQGPSNLVDYKRTKLADAANAGIERVKVEGEAAKQNEETALADKVVKGTAAVNITSDPTATTLDEHKEESMLQQKVATIDDNVATDINNIAAVHDAEQVRVLTEERNARLSTRIADLQNWLDNYDPKSPRQRSNLKTNIDEQQQAMEILGIPINEREVYLQGVTKENKKAQLAKEASHPHIKMATSAVNNNRGSAPVAPEYMVNAVKKLASTVKNVKEFTQGLVQRFGEAIKAHALKLWNWAKQTLKSQKGAIGLDINKTDKISPHISKPIVTTTTGALNPLETKYGSEKSIPVEPVIQQYSISKKKLGKVTDKKFVSKLTPPSAIGEKEQRRRYNESKDLETKQYTGELGFTPDDQEKETYQDLSSAVSLDEALEMMHSEHREKPAVIKTGHEAEHIHPEQKLLESLGIEGKKKPIKQSRALVIIEHAKDVGLLNPAKEVMVRDDISERLNKGLALTDEFLYKSIKRTLELPEETLVEPDEEIINTQHKTITESVTRPGLSESDISKQAARLQVKNGRLLTWLKQQLDRNENLNQEDVSLFMDTMNDLHDKDYLLAPIVKEVLGSTEDISKITELPNDDLFDLYGKIVNEEEKDVKQFTPERPERFHGPAIGSKERANLKTKESVVETSREKQKEQAFDYYKKTHKDTAELVKLARKVMSFIEEKRVADLSVNTKAINLLGAIQARYEEFKGAEGKRTLLKVLKAMNIDHTIDVDKAMSALLKDNPEYAYILGSVLTSEYEEATQRIKPSEAIEENRLVTQLGEQAEAESKETAIEEEEAYANINILNRQNIVKRPGQEIGSLKQQMYTVEMLGKSGKTYEAVISQSRINNMVEKGTWFRIIDKGQNFLDVLFDDFYDLTFIPKVLSKANELGFWSSSKQILNTANRENALKQWKEYLVVRKQMDTFKTEPIPKDVRKKSEDLEAMLRKTITPAKQFLVEQQLRKQEIGKELFTPDAIEQKAIQMQMNGVQITAPDIYHLFEESGYDVAITLSKLARLENINQIVNPQIIGSTAEGRTIISIPDTQPVVPVKPEAEKKTGTKTENEIKSENQKSAEEKRRAQTQRDIVAQTQQESLESLYLAKPYKDLNAHEKAFLDAMRSKYAEGHAPIIGKLRSKIVQGFFEKIANLFGAEVIIVRNADFDARYYPITSTDKPVLVINLDSPISFTRLFAHELFHHALNKISPQAYQSFKDGLRAVVDEQKWNSAVKRLMENRKDITPEQMFEMQQTFEFNANTKLDIQATGKDSRKPTRALVPVLGQLNKINLAEAEQFQKIKEEIEEELHSELFSYAFTKEGFWKALSNTFEGKSLAAKMTIHLMENATKMADVFSALHRELSSTPEAVSAQIVRDNALRGIVKEWFDVKDTITLDKEVPVLNARGEQVLDDNKKPLFTKTVYTYQGGVYELLATVLNEAYLSNTLRHSQIKNATTIISEIKDKTTGVYANKSESVKSYTKGIKSYRDVMTSIENVLIKAVQWIAKTKPASVFADFMADPKQVEAANYIAYKGAYEAEKAYFQVVDKHQDAFKGMNEQALMELHDKIVRDNVDVTTPEGLKKAQEAGLTPEQIQTFKEYKVVADKLYAELQKIYPELPKRAGHYGQSIRWLNSDRTIVDDSFDWTTDLDNSKLEGAKQWKKGKAQDKTTEQIKAEGFKYRTIDPHEMFLQYVEDANKLIALKTKIDEGFQNGMVSIFKNDKEALAKGYVPVSDNTFNVVRHMNLDLGYKLKDANGEYVQHEGQDAIYSTTDEANEAIISGALDGYSIEKIKGERAKHVSHYNVNRVWTFKGREYSKIITGVNTEQAAKDWIEAHKDDNNAYTITPQYQTDIDAVVAKIYVKPDFGRLLNILLSKDKFRQGNMFGVSGEQIMDVKNKFTSLELAMSLFHALTIGNELIASNIAWQHGRNGLGKSIIASNPTKAMKDARELVVLFKHIKADPDFAAHPEVKRKLNEILGTDSIDVIDVLDQYGLHGGSLHQDVSLRSSAHNIGKAKYNIGDRAYINENGQLVIENNKPVDWDTVKDSFKETANKLALEYPDSPITRWIKLGQFGALEYSTNWLMEQGIPKIKMAAFAKEYTLKLDQQKAQLESGIITKEEIARDTMKFIEDRFGEVNWQNMWMDKSVKTALQFAFRSFTWFTGSVKALSKSGIDIGKWGWFALKDIGLDPSDKRNYVLTEKGKWGIAALATHIFTATAITSIMVGASALLGKDVEPTDEDVPLVTRLLFPRVTADDANNRVSIPSYITEAYKIISHVGLIAGQDAEPSKLISGRFNGLVSTLFDQMKNSDYRGVNIRNKADNVFEQTLDSILYSVPKPIMFANLIKDSKEKGLRPEDFGLSLMGISDAPASANRSAALNKAMSVSKSEFKGKELTEDDMSEKNALRRAMIAWQHGDKSQVDNLLAEGRVTLRQVQIAKTRYPKFEGIENRSYMEPLKQKLQRISIEGALEVYNEMNSNQKEKYRRDIREKYFNMLSNKDKPKELKEKVKQKMKDLSLV